MKFGNLLGSGRLKLTPLKAEIVIKILQDTGFSFIRQTGGHVIMQDPDGRSVVIPVHPGEELGRGILRAIIRQSGLTRDEFLTKLVTIRK
ncbi:addiction module toxin, HicA family [Methanocalculus taiwanensis]|uniref:Addiction module toxin, HicA family n=2 Tax=Methanocalculus taiwanensis TaxID=106207 RepID=A0ABD4TMD8_9EURY|nr:type II toxin-antitoxin system HicA family toxin [Methanocalculus taiwanensis]MCQ1538445.1 addiction module toxin, HicA family [Methanocalculus taiwanensis]